MADILEDINAIKEEFVRDAEGVRNRDSLEELRIKYLGRKGSIPSCFKRLGEVDVDKKPLVGRELNILKKFAEDKLAKLSGQTAEKSETGKKIDASLPGFSRFFGKKHPLTKVRNELVSIFSSMGFEVAEGPEIETDYYNFEALNIPENHPAKNIQDTFYLDNGMLLRTHTSPVQVRVMEKRKPPIRIIAPGRVFRKDTPDATHSPVFNQIEGLYVDKGVTLAELKGVILAFAKCLFGEDMEIRFRPGYFPFTEPSVEYDFLCMFCKGKGCRVCKNTGWVEISGAGMVNPAVFRYVNINPEIYTGYAFGMGIDRIAMFKYQINDIRLFFENDIRFLEQF
ncbi:phenylalanine--tRNA ligase subunit alpha [candidate division KSB1 bacterium]